MGNAQAAVPARFDRSAQNRRSLIAKINIGRSQLGMVEDDYRALLFETTGQISLRQCDDAQLAAMVDALKHKGFRPLPRPGQPRPAQHPMARKARALWISLHHLGVVRNPGEPALEAFAKRQLKCERLVWARQSDAYKLIEALKVMAERHGWAQTNGAGKPLSPYLLQEGLCLAIVRRLAEAGAIPDHWTLEDTAFRLCGIETIGERPCTAEQFAQLAAALGKRLREALGPGGEEA
jgi:phage gp16-like protein